MYEVKKNYYVYRYLDKNGIPIYVGLTSRPLAQRVKEHKVEELNRETAKIQYIILPNESQMHQYEWYYIDYFKPKYNIKDLHDGEPSINNKYDCKWIDYPKDGDIKQLEQIVDILNQTVFRDCQRNYKIKITNVRNLIGVCSKRVISDNGILLRELVVSEKDFFNNDKRILIDILSQMIQFIAMENGVRASRNGNYFNKQLNSYFEKYGIKTKYTNAKNGYLPINCDKEILNLFSQYEFGSGNITIYTPSEGYRGGNGHSRKYQCVCCGNSVRATKNVNIICGDCNIRMELA